MGAPVTLGVVPGTVQALGLKYPSTLWLLNTRGWPATASGTLNVLNIGGITLVRILVGNPLRRLRIAFTCQPPMSLPGRPADSQRLPGPKGRAYTPLAARNCGTSIGATLFSRA